MGVMDALKKAEARQNPQSSAEKVWNSLTDDERSEIRSALATDIVGPGKLSELLQEEEVFVSKYFLSKVKAGLF